MSVVLIIGTGDMGERLAAGLATSGRVRRLVLAGRSSAALAVVAATVASVSDCLIEPVRADATRQDAVAELLARTRPDLVVQCAALRSPWALASRQDPAARAVAAAGLGLRLPYQLPVILSVMRAARDAGYAGPVANLSFPDVTGPVLRRLGLAPALRLGNAAMILRRVRAARPRQRLACRSYGYSRTIPRSTPRCRRSNPPTLMPRMPTLPPIRGHHRRQRSQTRSAAGERLSILANFQP